MRKVTEQFFCDICKREIDRKNMRDIKIPVLFKFDDTEGKPCVPYIGSPLLEICTDCLDNLVLIEKTDDGYKFRGNVEVIKCPTSKHSAGCERIGIKEVEDGSGKDV